MINSDTYKKARLQFLNDEIPETCKTCLEVEKSGGISIRNYADMRNRLTKDEMLVLTNGDGSIRSKLINIDFKFDSKCNLKCRICGDYFSDKWTEENEILYKKLDFVKYPNEKKNINIFTNKEFLKKLIDFSGNISYISIVGGEPMIIDEHWELLKILIKKKKSKSIKIWYNINGTFLPENAFEIWNQFKAVDIGISIDDIEKRFEYLRKGVKWEIILKNIEKIKNNSIVNFSINPTISWMSVYYLDEFNKFLNECSIPSIRNICVYYPNYLSPWILPEKIKENILRKNEKIMPENDYEKLSMQMKNNKTNMELLRKGIKFNKMLDKIRNESFKETFPELYEEIKDYWNDCSV